MEVAAGIEKDKNGQKTTLLRLTNQDIKDFKEYANHYSQQGGQEEDSTKRAKIHYDKLHTVWKEMNPA